MNSSSYWSKSGKERRRPRQNCYHRLGQYEETQYTLLQDSCDGHSGGAYPLQSQKSEHIFERELEPGDTLLTLSLQFNCPVAELKRINNILRDNEIFARRTVKVPVKPGSLLTERLAGVHASAAGSKEQGKLLINFDDSISSHTSNDGNLSSSSSLNDFERKEPITDNSPALENSVNLLSIDTSIANVLSHTVTPNSVLITSVCSDELDNQSPNIMFIKTGNEASLSRPLLHQEIPQLSKDPIPAYKCSGSDWGLAWPQLLICSLLLGFAGPILYVLYITEKQHPG